MKILSVIANRVLTLATFSFFLLFMWSGNLFAAEKIRIAATTTTIASLAKEVVGNAVEAEIYAIASPNRDIHFYAPTPKDVLKVKKADVLIHSGLDLEAWRDPLLVAAGNPRFLGEGKASIDVSKGIPLLEIPTSLSRAEGDIHLYGNPHYWTDPENAGVMTQNIAEGLARLYPAQADRFRQNADTFILKLREKMNDWLRRMKPHEGKALVTYHNSWPYLARRFGLVIAGHLEPKPGIPPTAKHLAELRQTMKEKNVRVIIRESFQEDRTPQKMAQETDAKVVSLASSVGQMKEATDYLSMMEENVRLLEEAL